MKKLAKRVIDIIGIPVTIITSIWNIVITRSNERVMPITYKLLRSFGVLPVRDHYYQPLINPQKHLKKRVDRDRFLPGIKMNVESQLDLLEKFNYQSELLSIPINKVSALGYHYNNGRYESGDAEYLYDMIRYFKPKNIIEIGCGMSTLMMMKAIQQNKTEDAAYSCNHICIEPFEMPWLESTGVEVHRKKVEDVPIDFFKKLTDNDILFIDSSHIIRPQGDVLIEYLEILPTLNKNVLVHIHDIFSPRDYPAEWLFVEHRLWNEQYLLEAYLSNNDKYEVVGALNFLKNNYFDQLSVACPILKSQPKRQPGAFWLRSLN